MGVQQAARGLERRLRVPDHLRDEIAHSMSLGRPLESIQGINESCRRIVEENRELGYCMLVSADGRVLYHDDPLLTGRRLTDNASVRAARSISDLVQPMTEDGIRYYDVSVPVLVRRKIRNSWLAVPTGMAITPPIFNCCSKAAGTSSGAAVTMTRSYGACSGHPR